MSTKKQEESYTTRSSRHGRFDKRLVQKIVADIELGVPRDQIAKEYGCAKVTLDEWMSRYGSKQYHANKRKRYTNLEKHTIARAIIEGRMSSGEACIAYRISSQGLINSWVRKYRLENELAFHEESPSMASEKKTSESCSELDLLKKALKDAELKIEALNTMIDVAEEELKIDIRKKSGAKQSSK